MMIDLTSLSVSIISLIGCDLTLCQSITERADQAQREAKGLSPIEHRLVIEPRRKISDNGVDVTITGYEDCGTISTAPADSKRCIVFTPNASTSMVDLNLPDGSVVSELWWSRMRDGELTVGRPNGEIIIRQTDKHESKQ